MFRLERSPFVGSFSQSEVYKRKSHTIEEEVMEVLEDMAE
jgi:hypothetical protein